MLKSLIRHRSGPTDPSGRPTGRDLTQGSLLRNIGYLAGPILISQLLFMAPSLYDAVWLGRIGPSAQAAAGLASSVRFTMISVLMALSGGSGAVVARHVGAKDWKGANCAVLQGVIMMAVSSGRSAWARKPGGTSCRTRARAYGGPSAAASMMTSRASSSPNSASL